MRILFVIHTPKDPHTAVYGNTAGRAGFLACHGHDVTIVTPEDFPRLKRLPIRFLPLFYPIFIAFWLMWRKRKYDLLCFHSYSGWVFNFCQRLMPASMRVRTMTMFHGLEPLYYNKLESEMKRIGQPLSLRYRLLHGALMLPLIRLSCRCSDLVTCLNRTEAAYLIEHRWSHPSRVVITPNGIRDSFFIERQWREKTRRILFVGQWLEMKGVRCLVEAFRNLSHLTPELSLWCVGTLIEVESVLMAFPNEVRRRVTVHSRVSQNELLEIYKEADLLIFPSFFEGFSIALLEGMATALPIVATRVGAVPDILESEVSALLVRENDAEALTAAVRRLIEDTTLCERLGRQAQVRAREYRQERIYENYRTLLEELLAGPRATEYRATRIELS